jgi:glycosyltransferase involved in cell wall biosynthesis
MNKLDLVSIIIPTYNRYELLLHSIQSCINQTYKNIEIIVINDCSTDHRYYSGELEKLDKTKIIHLPINMRIKHNANSAQGLTRQEGIKIAKGEWIAFLDDDDFYLPNKLSIQIDYMKKKNILFSSTNMFIINHNSISIDKLDFNVIRQYFNKGYVPKVLTFDIIEKNNFINNSSVVMHKSIVEKTGEFKAIKYEDWEYWKRALQYTDCYYIDIPLIYYTMTINGENNTKNYIAK